MYDAIVVGAGFSGAICAHQLACSGCKVLLLEKRNHVGGNMYDYFDEEGALIHKYGPHVLMTDEIWIKKFINALDDIVDIQVKMEVYIEKGLVVPLPINLNAIDKLYSSNKAKSIKEELIQGYGYGNEIHILNLLDSDNDIVKSFAEDIYNKIFKNYNMKMWGLKPQDIDKQIVGRVPVRISNNDIRSKRKYNFVPKHGYTYIFNKLLNHPLIEISLQTSSQKRLSIENDQVCLDGKKYNGITIYTAPLDELFDYKYGYLPYRSIWFHPYIVPSNDYFTGLAMTYPNIYKKFRTSDMERVTGVKRRKGIVLMSEYAGEYNPDDKRFNLPSYPVINDTNKLTYFKYFEKAKELKSFFFIGRLAEYRYYDMAETIERSFKLVKLIQNRRIDNGSI